MARTALSLRLGDLDAEKVAASVEKRLRRHAARMARGIGGGDAPPASEPGQKESLTASEAREVVLYAKEGLPSGARAEGHDVMREACERLAGLLWGRPIDGCVPAAGPLDASSRDDLDQPITLALVAAWARCELARGDGLTARQLGALAELDERSVRRLAGDGLKWQRQRGPGPLRASAADALEWLEGRGVRGLPKGKRRWPKR